MSKERSAPTALHSAWDRKRQQKSYAISPARTSLRLYFTPDELAELRDDITEALRGTDHEIST